jgi:hypothetical protein
VTEGNRGQRGLDRLVFFSDGIFAIAMTLLVLEIRVPEGPLDLAAAEVPAEVLALWPKFFSYVLSFLVIGIFILGTTLPLQLPTITFGEDSQREGLSTISARRPLYHSGGAAGAFVVSLHGEE